MLGITIERFVLFFVYPVGLSLLTGILCFGIGYSAGSGENDSLGEFLESDIRA